MSEDGLTVDFTLRPGIKFHHLAFPTGLGPRVEDITAGGISGLYMAPYEDLRLKRP
jgi:ABC-type transport system substrate-binding protein